MNPSSVWSRLFSSKTVWFNAIVFAVAFLSLPEFVKVLPPSLLPYDVLGGSLGNLILRIFFTNTPIAPVTVGFAPIPGLSPEKMGGTSTPTA